MTDCLKDALAFARRGGWAVGFLGCMALASGCSEGAGGGNDSSGNPSTTLVPGMTGTTGMNGTMMDNSMPDTSNVPDTTTVPNTTTMPDMTGGAGNGGTMDGTDPGVMDAEDTTMMEDPDVNDGGGAAMGAGECCADGNCLCHSEPPASHSLAEGPYDVGMYDLAGVGCVFFPTDAEPPFAAVAVSDGFTGTGGCRSRMTNGWGPLYASHGIVLLNVEVPSCCVPERADKLTAGIAALKAENENSSSELFGKLAGRYGVSGFSMGGGGSTIAASEDPTLLTNVAIMSHQPVSDVTVPTLFTCGSSDSAGFGGCSAHGGPAYDRMPAETPKGIFTVRSGHAGNPTDGNQGQYVLPFQKVFLEGDERWRDLLLSTPFDDSEGLE